MDSIPRNGTVTFNYGGYLTFEYDAKWSLRAGIAKTKFRYQIKGIPVSFLNTPQNFYNVHYVDGITNQNMGDIFADAQRFEIVQEFSYLEFPIELKYRLFDKKPYSIEAIEGVSTFFLKENTLTAESDNSGSIIFGSVKDFSNVYVSLNARIGFGYRITDDLKFNFEPIFKYHFNSSSNAMKAFSLSALLGFEYTFNLKNKAGATKK